MLYTQLKTDIVQRINLVFETKFFFLFFFHRFLEPAHDGSSLYVELNNN